MTRTRDDSTAAEEDATTDTSATRVATRTIDPAALADDHHVDYTERVYPHEDADHCESDAEGRAIVGVTREDGAVLLVVNPGEDHAILPHPTVEPDESYVAAARERTEEIAGTPVDVGEPLAVRRVDHYTVDAGEVDDPADFEPAPSAEPHNSTYHVVFAASVADGGAADTPGDAPGVDDPDWHADWFHELPVEVDESEAGDALDDLQRFLD